MSARHRLRLSEPAATFHDGFPLGNGMLGAMVHGRPEVERLDLNIDTLWSGGPLPAEDGLPASRLLPALREAIRGGDFVQADVIARQLHGPGYTQSYQPLGWLDWHYAGHQRIERYHRELDLARAVAITSYEGGKGPVEATSFVSAPSGVLVVSVAGNGTRAAALPLPRFASPHPLTRIDEHDEEGGSWLVAAGRAPSNVLPNYVDQLPAVRYDNEAPAADGTVAAGMGFAVVVAVQRVGPDEMRLIASAATGFRGFDQRPSADLDAIIGEARRRVSAALRHSTAALQEQHVQDYRGFFERADLDLSGSPRAGADPARAERLYHYGRYLLISSSRPGTQAANLQGIWNADVRPGWSSNYTTNINAQMNYWPAEPTALQDLHQPMFDLIRDLATAGTATAARYYAAGGSAVHHNTDIWRFTTPVPGDPQYSNWPSGLLWLAAHPWEHLEYGAEEDFAHTTALPILRSAAAFALDMLLPDPHGKLVMSPSTSPEHHFLTGTSHAATSEGAAMDQELIREVLTRYLRLAEQFVPDVAEDRALISRARTALAALRPVPIGSHGAILEWYDERQSREPGHRHLSHLYGLYPGTRITECGTPHDFAAAQRALRIRLENGSGYTGWSQAWVLCLAARLRDPELAERSISIILDELSSASLLGLHPHDDWPSGYIFQIDGNFGAVAGLTELLVQSHEQAISLLKTLPPSWPNGTIRGVRCRGGHRVDATWAERVLTSATVTTGGTGRVVLDVPEDSAGLRVIDDTGHEVQIAGEPGAAVGRRRIGWNCAPQTRYHVTRAGEPAKDEDVV